MPQPADLPMERLLGGEAHTLSIADLLSVLMISVDAVQAVLASYPTLSEIECADPLEMARIPILEPHPFARLLAARELSRRFAMEKIRHGTPIHSARDTYDLLAPLLRTETREVLIALALDTKSRLLCPPITIAVGTISSVPLHPREVFRPLIRAAASSCVVAHHHPNSGEPIPSPDDIVVTERLRDAASLLGIPLQDHLVIGRGCFVSMAERGLLRQ